MSRLAAEKACAIAPSAPDALVVGSDTSVVLGEEILGKPADPADAAQAARLQARADAAEAAGADPEEA